MYVADSGRIKRIETCLGTGESYFRAMAQLGYSKWQGKSVVIFGSGKVGSGLITYAHRYGSRITVVTRPGEITDRIRVLCDVVIDASDGIAIAEAVSQANAVVTATGVPGAATAACLSVGHHHNYNNNHQTNTKRKNRCNPYAVSCHIF